MVEQGQLFIAVDPAYGETGTVGMVGVRNNKIAFTRAHQIMPEYHQGAVDLWTSWLVLWHDLCDGPCLGRIRNYCCCNGGSTHER